MPKEKSLRARREERGWSQLQLADVAGVSARSVGRAENGTLKSDVLLEYIELALADQAAPLPGKSPRHRPGFRAIPADQQREIARLGGQAAHRLGRAHQWTPEEARAAGSKGGKKVAATRDMRELARRGGLARAKKRAAGETEPNTETTKETTCC